MSVADNIAIVGMACRFPGARNVAEFWDNIRNGIDSISRFDYEQLVASGVSGSLTRRPNYVPARGVMDDAERFDWRFFGYSPGEASTLEPQHRVFLECASTALDNAAVDPQRFPGWIGVFAGCDLPPRVSIEREDDAPRYVLGLEKDFLTTRVAYKLGLRGPSITVQTACSTSLVAVHYACQSLYAFECDMALAGGVAVALPQMSGYLHQEGSILSPDGTCRPFDADAVGTVPGSGVGIVVLKRLSDASRANDRIIAVIRGSAVGNDGSDKIGFTAPSIIGQRDTIRLAMAQAGVSGDQISYVEAHGTGTRVGDPVEIAALAAAFAPRTADRGTPCWLGAVKANIGHAGAAAGVAGLIKAVCMLEHRELVPTPHFSRPNPLIRIEETPFRICTKRMPWETNELAVAGVSSFGMGGTNAHVIVEAVPPCPEPVAAKPLSHAFCLSASTPEALQHLRNDLASTMLSAAAPRLADAAWTLATRRRRFAHRQVVVASTASELAEGLSEAPPSRADGLHAVAFLFPGQGTLRSGVARAAYELLPEFRAVFDEARELLCARGIDIAPWLSTEADAAWVMNTEHQQLGLFVVGYGLARQLRKWGITPTAMLGHSIGEYVAAAVAGMWTLPDALTLVRARGCAMHATAAGRMLLVHAPPSEFLAMGGPGESLVVAVEGSDYVVLAGPPDVIETRRVTLASSGVSVQLVATERAFHSPSMQPASAALRRAFAAIASHPPELPFVSNLTGGWADAAQVRSSEYWVRHLCETVRLGAGVEMLLARPDQVYLELGPGETMLHAMRTHPRWAGASARLLPTLGRSLGRERDCLLTTIGALWARGTDIDWDELFAGTPVRACALPAHPFEPRACDFRGRIMPEPPGGGAPAEEWLQVERWHQVDEVESYDHDLALAVGGRAEHELCPFLNRLGGRMKGAVASDVRDCASQSCELALGLAQVTDEIERARAATPAVVVHFFPAQWTVQGLNALDALEVSIPRLQQLGASLYVVAPGAADMLGGDAEHPGGSELVAWVEYHRRRPGSPRIMVLDPGSGDPPATVPVAVGSCGLCAFRGRRWWVRSAQGVHDARDAPDLLPQNVALLTWGHSPGAELAVALAERRWPIAVHAALDTPDCSLPTPTELAATLDCRYAAPALSQRLDLAEHLDAYVSALVVRVLLEAGVIRAGEILSREGLRLRLSPAARLPRLVGFIIDALVGEHWLLPHAGELLVTSPLSDAAEVLRAHEANLSELRGLCRVLRHCAQAYPAVLRGEREPLSVLFPDGDEDFLRAALADNEVTVGDAGVCLDALVQVVRNLASQDRPVRILEVGAGQGAVYSKLIDGWSGTDDFTYHYTDVSGLFVRRARERWANLGGLRTRFASFDITRDPIEQGLPAGGFDLILAYNVLHVAPSIAAVLRNLQRLLTPSGRLGLVELTRAPRWVHLIWGMAPGWWEFDDGLRADSPHLDAATWERVLHAEGFDDIAVIRPGDAADHVLILGARRMRAAADVNSIAAVLERQVSGRTIRDILVVPRFAARSNGTVAALRKLAGVLSAPSWSAEHRFIAVSEDEELPAGWRGQALRRQLDADPGGMPARWRHIEVERLDEHGISALADALRLSTLPAVVRIANRAQQPAIAARGREVFDTTEPPGSDTKHRTNTVPQVCSVEVTPAEAALRAGWCDVLGVSSVADDDDFFACGGDSFVAITLLSRAQEASGQRVPVSEFLRTPTFARLRELAGVARTPEVAAGSTRASATLTDRTVALPARPALPGNLVLLRDAGSRVPLFLMAPAAGSSLCYRHLADQLSPEQPCYGLDSPGLHDGDSPKRDIEEIAKHHVELIRHIHARGPYLLGGWSTGALVAHEVARRLATAGKTVAHLLLIDGYAPNSHGHPLATRPSYLIGGVAHWARARFAGLHRAVAGVSRAAKGGSPRARFEQQQMLDIGELARIGAANNQSPDFATVYRMTMAAVLRYRPRRVPCAATLFKADLKPTTRKRLEERLAPLYDGPVRVEPIPGTHWTVLRDPNAQHLARVIEPLLSQVTRQSGALRGYGTMSTQPNGSGAMPC